MPGGEEPNGMQSAYCMMLTLYRYACRRDCRCSRRSKPRRMRLERPHGGFPTFLCGLPSGSFA